MSISPHFEMSGDEARGLLYGLLESNKIQLGKYPDMPSVRQGIQEGKIKYRRADPDEHWQTYKEIADQLMFGGVAYADCEDLATAIAAEDQVRYGVQSLPYAYNPRPGLFHVVTAVPADQFGRIPHGSWPDARGAKPVAGYTFQDPSAAAGMGSFGALPSSEVSPMDSYGGMAPRSGPLSRPRGEFLRRLRRTRRIIRGVMTPEQWAANRRFWASYKDAQRGFRRGKISGAEFIAAIETLEGLRIPFTEEQAHELAEQMAELHQGESKMKHEYGALGGRGRGQRRGPFQGIGEAIAAFRKGVIGDETLANIAYQAGAGARGATGLEGEWARGLGEQIPGVVGIPMVSKPEPVPKPGPEEDEEEEDLEEEEAFGALYGFDDMIEQGASEAMGGLIGADHFHNLANPSGFTRGNTLLEDLDEDAFGYDGYAEGHTPMDPILAAEELYGLDDDDDDWYGLDEDDEDDEDDDFGLYDGYAEGHTPMDPILGAELAYGAIQFPAPATRSHLTPPAHMRPPAHMQPRVLSRPRATASFGLERMDLFRGTGDLDDVIDDAVYGVIGRLDLFGED